MARRIAILSRNLPPLRGGMERLGQLMIEALQDDAACHVIGPPGSSAHLPPTVTVEECRGAAALPYLLETALRVMYAALRHPRPAYVLAASGLTAPLAWLYARLARCPYVVVVHGLDIVADSCVYQRVFVPRLRSAARVVANSRNTARLARERGVPDAVLRIVHPGIAWPVTLPKADDFRARHDLGDGPVLLAVGRLTARKGVAEFIVECLPDLLAAHPGLHFVVIGGEARQAIRNEISTRVQIERAIGGGALAAAVRLLGDVDDVELGRAYVSADLHVFPLLDVPGDVEGFGMVAAEAAAHGLLTVAFATGGVVDAVEEGVTGTLAPPGDHGALTARILALLPQARDAERRRGCRESARRFAGEAYGQALRTALADLGAGTRGSA